MWTLLHVKAAAKASMLIWFTMLFNFQSRGILEMARNDDSLASVSNNIVIGDWAQVEIINLVNDGTGLGFGMN